MPGQIALADNAYNLSSIVDNGQPPHLMARHLAHALIDRVIDVTGEGPVRHTIGHNSIRHVRLFGDEPHHDVTIGHHSYQPTDMINHRNRPAIPIAHHAGRIHDRIPWLDDE